MRRRVSQEEAANDNTSGWRHYETLKRWEKNPRKNQAAVPRVARSIKRFGFVAPVVIWIGGDRMVAGDTRLLAMREIMTEDPSFTPKGAPGPGMVRVVFHDFDSEEDANAYAVADNRLNEIADWDDAMLRLQLDTMSPELKLTIGMDDYVLGPEKPTYGGDEVPPVPVTPVSKLGDLYTLGRHRLLCGSSTSAPDMKRLMGGMMATLLWTDPPYNVAIVGGSHTLPPEKRRQQGKHVIENDQMGDAEFRAFLTSAFKTFDPYLIPGAIFYIAHADTEGYNFRGAVRDANWKHAQSLVWLKDSLVIGRQDYQWIHEPILYGWKLGAGHMRLKDRTQTTVWEVPRPKRSEEHPTMKPPELIERAIANSTKQDGVILDGFGGSGSTLIAAERTGRSACLMELDPRYVDVIVKRWETMTGEKAKRIRNTKAERRAEAEAELEAAAP